MRTIKFRFWSKILNGFVSPDDGILAGTFKDEKMIVMQYTELRDTNGYEIYEGDIVKCEHNAIGFVTWDKDHGCYWVMKNEESGMGSLGYQIRDSVGRKKTVRIMGNIYENPELLHG